ncbi:polyunsaturated fatty acid synthase PfaA [Megasphaera cerevisiae DSM 20462]|jgi:sigma-E factor negative regulatory protein RseC|uniref:Polyunsaturated fatty acid synthase PfaA n=1 Tax=Megasphaera cerevisiae DSM 20462 TaxID=1122219 RepID=A0A0J6WTG1_9FIRM|nr:SoxR reducing system RseC family protein [Megasphaera cerevisiae]KMO86825.1 polyunsaturated fatty acid synthase PfaA [Megasphaera cerevisiae DSM 20462]MCI1750995.1 SoxR reducing system RseC family protein [Megasphaera cerevisiae]SJZ85137.1 positive regulator of sigma(E), RseC/MucC [Megasphaera cerevisiae DSM 20462]
MKTEEGTILSVDDNGCVEIKVGRHSDCIACGACPGAESIVVTALNPVGAQVGQHVKFEVREVNVVIGAFVCFVMPLLIAAAGAFAGHWVGLSNGFDAVQAAIVGGIIGFVIGAVGVKLFDRSLTNDVAAKPKITEIVA